VLTIGLPLAAGLTLREMAGVLAHEFGHFAQGTGMRLTYVIRVVNGWFARVVYERDQWDEQLLAAQQADNWALQLFVALARLMVWLTRKILWVLMVVGHGISAFMLRQMEFDADRYEARVAGVDAFATTTEKLATLGLGMHAAMSDLGDAWRERRLCDDLPALVRNREATIPAELRTLVVARHAQAKTGWFDTHPAAAARVASARREGAAGVVKVDAPAPRCSPTSPSSPRHHADPLPPDARGGP
jgi:Zn-dependent protease with chaperone function